MFQLPTVSMLLDLNPKVTYFLKSYKKWVLKWEKVGARYITML